MRLEIDDLKILEKSKSINESFNFKRIIGLAGLEGHGQSNFLESLAGVYKPYHGLIRVGGKQIDSLKKAKKYGISYLPADRKKNGIFPKLNVFDNFRLGNLDGFSSFGFINHTRSKKSFLKFIDELSIKFASEKSIIGSLSGGNQQKILLARCLSSSPKIILLNDPTRGVDINTRKIIYDYLLKLVLEQDVLVIILSTELEEILNFCDEVLIFRDFDLSGKIKKENMSMDKLLAAMFGTDSFR